jgi:integrase
MLTEATIRSALRTAPTSGKAVIELKDDGARGEGRLALFIRTADERISTEWYAVWYRDDKRRLAKLGAYPTMSLGDARKKFREEYAPVISRGDEPERPRARRYGDADVENLFKAYVAHLKTEKKGTVVPTRFLLGPENGGRRRPGRPNVQCAADAIGRKKRASDVTHKDIIPHLKEIHERGAVTGASAARAFISAAFSFAMQSANTYHREAGDVDWGVTINPVSAIPLDPESKRVGTRYLTPAEYRDFWHWLLTQVQVSRAACGVLLCMATGQRLSEMLSLTNSKGVADDYAKQDVRLGVYDAGQATIDWWKTKNRMPHTYPLPTQAVDILALVPVNRNGLYFPHQWDDATIMTLNALDQLTGRYLRDNPTVPHFTPRDIRRTWKTLAGAAGLSKEIRDRLQNHAMTDISSRHYDRYSYLAEKREAVKTWSAYMDRIISGDLDRPVTRIDGGQVVEGA